MTRRWQLEQTQTVPKPRSEVFAFFADAHNLEGLKRSPLSTEVRSEDEFAASSPLAHRHLPGHPEPKEDHQDTRAR